jgi:hypothetical protein
MEKKAKIYLPTHKCLSLRPVASTLQIANTGTSTTGSSAQNTDPDFRLQS